MEKSPSWSRAHDWKSCRGQKLLESSNLSISAKNPANKLFKPVCGVFFMPALPLLKVKIVHLVAPD